MSGMSVLRIGLSTTLALHLVLVQPWLGRRVYRRLVADLAVDPTARLRHYRRSTLMKWALAAVVGVLALLTPHRFRDLPRGYPSYGWRAAAPVVLALVATTIALAVAATRPAGRVAMARMARGFLALLPTSRRERWAFAGVAVTAGVTEEVLYRLFLLNFLRWLWPGGGLRGALVLSAVAFGLVHLYQGVRGVVTTGIAGWLLGAFYLGTRSLVLPMLVHTLVDLRILVLPDLSGVGDEQRDAGGTRVAEQVRQPHVAREAD